MQQAADVIKQQYTVCAKWLISGEIHLKGGRMPDVT